MRTPSRPEDGTVAVSVRLLQPRVGSYQESAADIFLCFGEPRRYHQNAFATRGGMCEWLKQAVLKTALP
jgi:hypothetical protein